MAQPCQQQQQQRLEKQPGCLRRQHLSHRRHARERRTRRGGSRRVSYLLQQQPLRLGERNQGPGTQDKSGNWGRPPGCGLRISPPSRQMRLTGALAAGRQRRRRGLSAPRAGSVSGERSRMRPYLMEGRHRAVSSPGSERTVRRCGMRSAGAVRGRRRGRPREPSRSPPRTGPRQLPSRPRFQTPSWGPSLTPCRPPSPLPAREPSRAPLRTLGRTGARKPPSRQRSRTPRRRPSPVP